MVQQRRRLDSYSLRDIAQAGAAISPLGEQHLRHLQHAVARIGRPPQIDHFGAGVCTRIFRNASHCRAKISI
jgi:hypothetical protein